jgi:AraC-like DNA-binding protein
MGITLRRPSPPLDAYIARLWSSEGPPPYPRMAALPTPSLQLMVNFGSTYHVYEASTERGEPCATCAESWAIGLRNRPYVMVWPCDLQLVTVSFRLGGAAPFLRLPLAELRNQIVSLDAIWGSAATEIRERLGALPTPQERLALLERLLLERLARLGESPRGLDPGLAAARYAVAELARAGGALSIRALAERIGMSHKHLITQFQQLVGGTPKAVARIYRLQRVLNSIDATRPRLWAEVAHQAGYYDEAHFNREFQVFTGRTPTAYLRVLRQARLERPDFALYPTFLPSG